MLRVLSLFLIAAIAGAALTHGRWWQLPDAYNPWAPLRFDEPPNWLTRHKLQRLDDDPAACLALLESTPLQAAPVPDRIAAGGCGYANAVQVHRTALQLEQAFTLSCRSAVSLALWERHVLQPQAEALLGSPVQRLQHFGSYACRKVYGREGGRLSQHASADALDVSGFVLRDGRRVTVARDWGGGGAEAQFLRAVHAGACAWFDGVYGPAYNAAHADHFHLDRGPFRLCR